MNGASHIWYGNVKIVFGGKNAINYVTSQIGIGRESDFSIACYFGRWWK